MEWPQDLLELFDDPLLEDVRPNPTPVSPDDRRVKTLYEITDWVEANEGRKPESTGDLKEKMMARSLSALTRDVHEGLRVYDRLNLLKEEDE